jgi:hypothetical protein
LLRCRTRREWRICCDSRGVPPEKRQISALFREGRGNALSTIFFHQIVIF